MILRLSITAILLLAGFNSFAQEVEKRDLGKIDGRARLYLMNTLNEGGLTDYFASAMGVGLGYSSPMIKGFQFRTSAFYTQGLYNSDLTTPDPLTNAANRYEIGLYDVGNPSSRSVFRVEELYLQYKSESSYLRLGRQLLNTPFINPQDGRMSPTFVQGIYGNLQLSTQWNVEGGWLNRMAPRSTSRWFGVGESMGYYPQGLLETGQGANYFSNIESVGIGILGVHFRPNSKFQISAWNYFVENVLNIGHIQVTGNFPADEKWSIISGVQLTRQDAINDGGNSDLTKTYLNPSSYSNVLSARLGAKNQRVEFNLNYTRISKTGRFQFPREWGRDPFFTFMPRERNEGYGGVDALMAKFEYSLNSGKTKLSLSHGRFSLPEANDAKYNKYGIPSYHQSNFELRQQINPSIQLQYLAVYKGRVGDTYGNDRFVINKVNMFYQNLVVNYKF
ncbi:OprD family outer membrane porin [Peijinzhouia sedimentorum]